MLLTISTTHRPATDLGYLLHKNPAKVQDFELSFGHAHVFYPEATEERCTAGLLLDIEPLKLVRGPGAMLHDYVNDRPYVSSSFLSVAIAQVLGTALAGRSKERAELAKTPIPLTTKLAAVPCRGGEKLIEQLFGPLGYQTTVDGGTAHDEESRYRNVTLASEKTLSDLLSHVYVMLPVLDNRKHYWIGKAELDKLLAHGEGWLEEHPARDLIVRRYLGHRRSLTDEATTRLNPGPDETADNGDGEGNTSTPEPPRLHEIRDKWVIEQLQAAGASRIVDYGCGEGQLLRRLIELPEFSEIVGAEGSALALEIAERRLRLHKRRQADRGRVKLLQTGLTYRDARLNGYDAAAVVEVIEHVDPERLTAFERALFGAACPRTIVLTTPNREYNARFETVRANGLRHRDHRFEWTRAEFEEWAKRVAAEHGYQVGTTPIGAEDTQLGAPTQGARFTRCN